jgi:5,10-methylenetetrahydromethanopterin reductase
MSECPIGLVLGATIPPEAILEPAQIADREGLSEVWLGEDYFFTAGVSAAAAVLATTQRVPVGIGVASAMTRHPALLAMEASTMERMFPGRLRLGIGLGATHWVKQMGVYPRSPLRAVRECVDATRRLLRGEELDLEGEFFTFDKVRLAHPVDHEMPIVLGGIGPKMLELAGEVADETVLSIFAGPAYVRWACERIAAGAERAGREPGQRVTVFAFACVDRDAQRARDLLRPLFGGYLADMGATALTDVPGLSTQVAELAALGPERFAAEMPAEWMSELGIVGDPDEVAGQVRALLDAGADQVMLFPMPLDGIPEVARLTAAEVLPLL